MRFFFVCAVIWCFSLGAVFADGILPPSYKLPGTPSPGSHGCTSCGSGDSEGNEIPYVNPMSVVMMKINLLEELDTIDFGHGLLTIIPGANAVFAPESRYILQPPNERQDYIRVLLNEVPLRFRAKFDEIGQSSFFSYILPGYSLSRDGNSLLVTNHNDQIEYRFVSLDGGISWKIDTIRKQHSPARQIQCRYNNDGLITEIVLHNAHKYLLEYKFGQVVKVTSPAGAITVVEWNENGSLKRINTTLLPEHPLYIGNVKKDRRGKVETPVVRDLHFTCSPQGVLQEVVNSSGERYSIRSSTSNKGNAGERLTIIIHPDGTRKFQKSVTAPGSRTIEQGIVISKDKKEEFVTTKIQEFEPKDGIWISKGTIGRKYEYRAPFHAITAEIDPYNNRTTYNYNVCGLKTSDIYPDKTRKTWEYDARWNKIKEVDECGRTKTWTYDDNNRLVQFQYGDLITTYEYDEKGRLVKSITPGKLSHVFEWDTNSRLVSYIRPDGVSAEYQYYGSLDKIQALNIVANDKSEKYIRTFDYDLQGRLKRINYPDKTYEEFAYDCCSMISQRDRAGAIRKHVYNQMKQKTHDIDPMGGITTYEYNETGNLAKVTKPDQSSTWYKYSPDGKLLATGGTNRLEETYEYDKMDQISIIKLSDGRQIERNYDKRGRLLKVTGDGATNIEGTYDKSGNIIKIFDWGLPKEEKPRISHYTIDIMNRRIGATVGEIDNTIVYLPETSLIDHRIQQGIYQFFKYDEFGRQISSAQISQAELNTAVSKEEHKQLIRNHCIELISYDPYGNLTEIRDGQNNLLAQYTFSPDGQLKTILRPVSNTQAELQTYKHYYNQKSEQIFEIYQKTISMEKKL